MSERLQWALTVIAFLITMYFMIFGIPDHPLW
jgi:hypothetical protein